MSARHPPTISAWVLLAVLTVVTCVSTLRADYRDEPLVADQAAQLLQAESLAYDGHDLSFDAQDLARVRQHDLGWRDTPYLSGLFYQRNDDGWAFAKPYGYSAVLAGPLRLLGPAVGVAVTNTALLLALEALVAVLLLLHHRGPAVPLVTAGVVLVSNTVIHAYPLVVELFTAVVVGLFLYGTLRGARDGRLAWSALGFAAAGVMLAEKAPLAVVVAPVALVALARTPSWGRRLVLVGVAAAVAALAALPYVAASDGVSATPYGGERYYAEGAVPFGDEPARLVTAPTESVLSVGYVTDALTDGWAEKAEATATYVVGRHTGLAVFMPVSVVVLALTVGPAVLALATGRRPALDAMAVAVLAATLGYVALYTVLFPRNYFGGGQAFGNRYFVQVCPLVAALASTARLPARRLTLGASAALALGAVVLWPHLTRPADALVRLDTTSPVQRLFPFEGRRYGWADYFECGQGSCAPGGGPEVGEVRRAGGAIGRQVVASRRAGRDLAANPAPPPGGG